MSRVRKVAGSNKRLWIFIAVALSVFFLIFTSAKGKYHFPLSERIVTSAVAPFLGPVNEVGNHMRRMTAGIWEIAAVYEQNQMLRSEVTQLREMQVQMNEIAAENQRLHALLGYKQTMVQFDLLVANVVARDPGNWTNSILINLGSGDGIQKDMTVVNAGGLVGNVAEVFAETSRVQLILDPRSSVGAIVQRPESRVAGIVEGSLDHNLAARMVNIARDADIVVGDQIVTSGFGGIYPKGIAVGVVNSIADAEGGLLKYAIVKPVVDFQKLEEVAVIIRSREAPPAPLTPPPADTSSSGGKK